MLDNICWQGQAASCASLLRCVLQFVMDQMLCCDSLVVRVLFACQHIAWRFQTSEIRKAFGAHLDLCCRNHSFYQCSPFSVQCYRSISAKCQIMRKSLPMKAFECVHTTCILKYVFPIFSNFSENTLNIFEGKTLIFNMQIMTCRIYLNVDRIMCTHQPFHSHALKIF